MHMLARTKLLGEVLSKIWIMEPGNRKEVPELLKIPLHSESHIDKEESFGGIVRKDMNGIHW